MGTTRRRQQRDKTATSPTFGVPGAIAIRFAPNNSSRCAAEGRVPLRHYGVVHEHATRHVSALLQIRGDQSPPFGFLWIQN